MSSKDPRIVLLERDDVARELYTEYLVGDGFRVRPEALFDDAMAALKKGTVPLVVAGIAPGSATVAQIAAAIRRVSPTTQLLALLSREAAEGTLRAVRDGALEALTKPVQADTLALAVRRCLGTAALLDARPEMRRQLNAYQAARRLQRATDAASLAEQLLDACLTASGAEAGVVMHQADGTMEVWAARQLDEQAARELAAGLDWPALRAASSTVVWVPPIPDAAQPAPKARGKALAQLALVRVGGAALHDGAPPDSGNGSADAAPLWVGLAFGAKAAAALHAGGETERARREIELAIYAAEAGFALSMLRRYPEGSREGSIDPLTDLIDARSLARSIANEIHLAGKGERPCAVLTVDIERLAEVREPHGPLVAGQALVECARLLVRQVRETDLVARTGEESFGVLLPATSLAGARPVAERIEKTVAGRRFLAREGLDLSLGVRVGVAVFPDHGKDAAALLDAAHRGDAAPAGRVLGRRRTRS